MEENVSFSDSLCRRVLAEFRAAILLRPAGFPGCCRWKLHLFLDDCRRKQAPPGIRA